MLLAPWQRDRLDVAGELLPDGRLRYQRVVWIVPRRAGKTYALLCYLLAVSALRTRARTFYASHVRETAAALWRDEWFPMVESSPLFPRYVACRRSNGSESITWRPVAGSSTGTVRLLPPDGDRMRSFRADVAVIDEAREFTLDAGLAIEAAAFPTMATGLGGQAWIVSNAGTDAATWLIRWRDFGRAAVTNPDSVTCYLEYGAPDDADQDDESTWWAAHPGLGSHVLIDALRADNETMPPDVFGAEYLGRWPAARIDAELVAGWELGRRDVAPLAGPLVLAVELDPNRSTATVVASDGITVELVEHREHGPWLVPRVAELVARHRPSGLVWDRSGPVHALADELDRLPARPLPLGLADVMAAHGATFDAIRAGLVLHNGSPELTAAVAGERRKVAAGAWVWDRRQPGAGPLIAAALARHTARQAGPPTVR